MTRVLIVDDDLVQLRLTAEVATRAGFATVTATSGRQALECLRADPGIGAMVLDLVMPDLDGMAVLETMRRESLTTPVIVQTAHSSLETVVTAMRQGAVDFFVKPVAPERLIVSLRNALKLGELETLVRTDRSRRTGTLEPDRPRDQVPGHGPRHLALQQGRPKRHSGADRRRDRRRQGTDGAGHPGLGRPGRQGLRHRQLCGAIPPTWSNSILFGHRRAPSPAPSPTTPASSSRPMAAPSFSTKSANCRSTPRSKLLRVLQEGEIEPVGCRPGRCGSMCASSRRPTGGCLNLAKAGAFREDLYYRLNVFPIYVPPLRDRAEDIAAAGQPLHRPARRRSRQARRRHLRARPWTLLKAYNWPGNIRQLENAIYRAVVLADGRLSRTGRLPADRRALWRRRAEALRLTEAAPEPSAPVHIDDASIRTARRRDRTSSPTASSPAMAKSQPLPMSNAI